MFVNRIIVILLYVSIYVLLVFPVLEQGMFEIGSLHIYFFEIPLVLAYILSVLTLLLQTKPMNRGIYRVYFLFIPIVFIGFFGAAIHAKVGAATILKDLRPILYWLPGMALAFVGHRHLRLKTLSWVVVAGLLTQFSVALLMVSMDPSLLFLHGFRLPGRSGYLTLFFVALFLMMMTHKKSLLSIRQYKITPIAIIVIPLLMQVILGQNRTTWIGLFLVLAWWLALHTTFANKLKFVFLSPILLLIIWQALQFIPYSSDIGHYLHTRLFVSTLSEEGVKSTWEGNRSVIYESNLNDFRQKPILGHGFGKQFYFAFAEYGEKEDKEISGCDNSFMTVLVKTGLAGLIFFIVAIYKMYSIMKTATSRINFSEEWLYLKSMIFVFPFYILISLNINILYGYPEVMIFSLFFAKAALLSNEVYRSKPEGSNRSMANNFPKQGNVK